jgi:hypothetical protein
MVDKPRWIGGVLFFLPIPKKVTIDLPANPFPIQKTGHHR